MKNESNVLKRICRLLTLAIVLCALSAATARAQAPTVSVEAKDVTVKELLRRIEANSPYTFAYVDAEIDTTKHVSVNAENRTIESILSEVLPDTGVEIKGLKIILTARTGGGGESRSPARR